MVYLLGSAVYLGVVAALLLDKKVTIRDGDDLCAVTKSCFTKRRELFYAPQKKETPNPTNIQSINWQNSWKNQQIHH